MLTTLPSAPMAAPLTSAAGPAVKCRLSSRTTIVLLLLLSYTPGAASAALTASKASLAFSEVGREALLSPGTALGRKTALSLVEIIHQAWEEATPQPKNRGRVCTKDADCAWHASCSATTQHCEVLGLGEQLGTDISMCLLAFVIAGFSLAAGVGGGGLYVPLLMFMLSFDTRVATALSQAMLFGGAFAAFIYNIQMSHPANAERPLINFELALLMAPALMGGAQVGSVVHALAPPLLTLVLLIIVLGDAARKGIRSAMSIKAKEEKEDAANDSPASDAAAPDAPTHKPSEVVLERSRDTRTRLFLVWVVCIGLVVTKGLLFEMCSTTWWILTVGSALFLCGLSWLVAGTLSEQVPVDDDDIDFREKAFPLAKMSIVAGAIAALCGIGGGMVMGPILVELKIPPPVSTATTATTLVVLSTSTLLIYICRGMAPPEYAICLSVFTMMGAAVGKVLCGWWVQKTGKQSVIVWILAGVTVISMVLMGLQGILTLARDPSDAFAFKNFCEGHMHHTVPTTD